ncbi:hypothetical protein BC832DRAFT_543147 [Gaertneriomyces semiglobifer]|nr:hypothetical protein BC832DRAFT_543147 [Gaertneriomyces semiglobifer]
MCKCAGAIATVCMAMIAWLYRQPKKENTWLNGFPTILKHVDQHTFGRITFEWIENLAHSTKSLRRMRDDGQGSFAIDVIGLAKADGAELCFLEHSSSVELSSLGSMHASEDTMKLENETIDGIKYQLCNFLKLHNRDESVCSARISGRMTLENTARRGTGHHPRIQPVSGMHSDQLGNDWRNVSKPKGETSAGSGTASAPETRRLA